MEGYMPGDTNLDSSHWNLWECDPKTKVLTKWRGMITDPETGFAWLTSRGLDRSRFRINNVPSHNGRLDFPNNEVYAVEGGGTVVGDKPPKKTPTARARKASKRASKRTNKVPRITTQPVTRVAKKTRPESAESKALRADAKKRLGQVKAEEAAEV